jgi:hypothetical protein
MKRFRFVGDPTEYETKKYGQSFKVGKIYDPSHLGEGRKLPVLEYAKDFPNDWQAVFDEPKPLLKDTDLGYFSIEIIKAIFQSTPVRQGENKSGNEFVTDCINLAKELIKQLEEETK